MPPSPRAPTPLPGPETSARLQARRCLAPFSGGMFHERSADCGDFTLQMGMRHDNLMNMQRRCLSRPLQLSGEQVALCRVEGGQRRRRRPDLRAWPVALGRLGCAGHCRPI